jgi:hypothetical protein
MDLPVMSELVFDVTSRFRRLMLYFAVQCTETPFRERFGAIKPTPVD